MTRTLNIGLTPEQKAARANHIGGSDANIIMSGDTDKILQLWRVKRGEAEPENLDHVLPVIMGQWTEELNRYWYELKTSRTVTDDGKQIIHPQYRFMACTLDGLTTTEDGSPAIFEAKHVNAFSKIEDVVQRYMPQLHHNMAVAGVQKAILSVFKGTMEYEAFEVEEDFLYSAQLIDAEKAFWECVQNGKPPVAVQVATPQVDRKRHVDMTGSNEWSALAADFIKNEAAAKSFEKAKAGFKTLIPDDAATAFGYGVIANVAKNGAVKITKQKEE